MNSSSWSCAIPLRRWFVVSVVVCVVVCGAAPAGAAPNRCAGPAYRAFDFFLGSWVARHLDGKDFGAAVVTKVLGECALRVDWHGGKYDGTSYNMWVADEKRWQKSWFDDMGNTEIVTGHASPGLLVYEGTARERQREEWRRISDREVRQTYRISRDSGTTWKIGFILVYYKLSK
jgi:hypothetical protein